MNQKSDVIAVVCLDCKAITRFEEKTVDDNRAMHGAPQFCPYCGKRSLE